MHSILVSFNSIWNHIQDILNCAPVTVLKKSAVYSSEKFQKDAINKYWNKYKKGRKAEVWQIFPINIYIWFHSKQICLQKKKTTTCLCNINLLYYQTVCKFAVGPLWFRRCKILSWKEWNLNPYGNNGCKIQRGKKKSLFMGGGSVQCQAQSKSREPGVQPSPHAKIFKTY